MGSRSQTLVFDPIPFKGGSKIATSDALNLCNRKNCEFIILTVDPAYWQATELCSHNEVRVAKLWHVAWLMKHHHGYLYWLNQGLLLIQLLFSLLRFGHIHQVVGASGPGIDMPIYLARRLFTYRVTQLIHGNVGRSRSIGYCLAQAEAVFYLPSTKQSLLAALECYLAHATGVSDSRVLAKFYLNSSSYQSFINGLPHARWPTQAQQDLPICFWAASLLKWKGLDLFVEALKECSRFKPVSANICFIRPKDTCLPISEAPINIRHIKWYDDPVDLDAIRAQSNIFISTSQKEPFGLSILEALAAGMCVIIPQDGAFWDNELTHDQDCIKYQPDDVHSLVNALLYATNDASVLNRCQANALQTAEQYKAEYRYLRLAQHINSDAVTPVIHICE
ncbi:glycosyltransferase family 4 protein [Vibrio hepatarius]|uniref:glycosyltransferase family 4 protein n=1 Tax=Vibrio hepatarius TaxID=171383 RepID=UPI00373584D6